MRGLHLIHCLLKVSDDVVDILDADAETNQVWSYTSLAELLFGHLTMCV